MALVLLSKSSGLTRKLPPTLSVRLIRHGSHGPPGRWNPDWRASPRMPVTMEEKIAASKKYNLHPADYKPIDPDDPTKGKLVRPFGDYPDLPAISHNERDPYEPWDYPRLRRNYGEPLHIDFDMYIGERVDTRRQRNSLLYMTSCFLGTCAFFFALFYTTRNLYTFTPMMPKQYPYNDLWVEKGGDPSKMPIRINHTFEQEGVDHTTPIRWI